MLKSKKNSRIFWLVLFLFLSFILGNMIAMPVEAGGDTIEFNANEGIIVETQANTVKYHGKDDILSLPTAYREGYYCEGWYSTDKTNVAYDLEEVKSQIDAGSRSFYASYININPNDNYEIELPSVISNAKCEWKTSDDGVTVCEGNTLKVEEVRGVAYYCSITVDGKEVARTKDIMPTKIIFLPNEEGVGIEIIKYQFKGRSIIIEGSDQYVKEGYKLAGWSAPNWDYYIGDKFKVYCDDDIILEPFWEKYEEPVKQEEQEEHQEQPSDNNNNNNNNSEPVKEEAEPPIPVRVYEATENTTTEKWNKAYVSDASSSHGNLGNHYKAVAPASISNNAVSGWNLIKQDINSKSDESLKQTAYEVNMNTSTKLDNETLDTLSIKSLPYARFKFENNMTFVIPTDIAEENNEAFKTVSSNDAEFYLDICCNTTDDIYNKVIDTQFIPLNLIKSVNGNEKSRMIAVRTNNQDMLNIGAIKLKQVDKTKTKVSLYLYDKENNALKTCGTFDYDENGQAIVFASFANWNLLVVEE